MRLLLDTNVLIWSAYSTSRLSERAVEVLRDLDNVRVLSSVNVWEVCVKASLGKLQLDRSLKEFIELARRSLLTTSLSFSGNHALLGATLPSLHRDPFDRMLVCQAMVHDLTVLTPDPILRSYPIKSMW